MPDFAFAESWANKAVGPKATAKIPDTERLVQYIMKSIWMVRIPRCLLCLVVDEASLDTQSCRQRVQESKGVVFKTTLIEFKILRRPKIL